MPNVLAMSFEGELAPSFRLRCLAPGRTLPDGWGLGYYPGGEPSATVLKEPAPPQGSIRGQLAEAWEHLESSLFMLHIRSATWGAISDANTQPFVRSWGRRDWMMAHSGSLDRKLPPNEVALFEPVGSTDTEQIFCALMSYLAEMRWRSLAEVDLDAVHGWMAAVNTTGALTLCITDGRDLLACADQRGAPLWLGVLAPPYETIAFGDGDLEIDLTARGAKSRKGVILCSAPLGPVAAASDAGTAIEWKRVEPGSLLLVRQGVVVAERDSRIPAPVSPEMSAPIGDAPPRPPRLARPSRAEIQRYAVTHRTVYTYDKPIERSHHVFRVRPVHDRLQQLLSHELSISVPGQARDYEDVFGNGVRRLAVDTSFAEMVIEARSQVEVQDVDPLGFRPLRAGSTIPLVWMPWQRQVLDPYLLPPELPESELAELAEYAMSFVKRNESDLLDTLLDINTSIHRDYEYKQGETTVMTTAFETYVHRRGVCQDFTNLMICLCRLLGVPARYVCGYIHTGTAYANQAQGDASHAWVQLYLPQVGWKGFDPTNGILTQTDHVRVAVGRNYLDATPTSGTIYVGGGGEKLAVDVRIERL